MSNQPNQINNQGFDPNTNNVPQQSDPYNFTNYTDNPVEQYPYAQQPDFTQESTVSPDYNMAPPVQIPPQMPIGGEESSRPNLKRFIPFIAIGLVALLILGLVLFLLSRRGSTESTEDNKSVVLQWWGLFMDPETIQPLLDEYNKQNPNVTIEYANKWSDIGADEASLKYQTELNRVLKSNDQVQIPDIFMLHNDWMGDYEKYVKPSSSYDYESFNNTFYPNITKDFTSNNVVYGVPLWVDTFAVLTNKDLLASKAVLNVPKEWPQFKALAQSLTTRESNKIKQSGFAAGTSANVSYAFELANILLMQNGVAITDNANKAIFSQDPDSVTALNFFSDFANGTGGTWDATFKNESAAFLENDVAMIIASSYRLRNILKYNEEYGINLDIGVAQIPQLQGQDQAVINFGDYWGNVVSLSRPNSIQAWKFLNWITQSEQLKKLSENIKNKEGNFGILYPRKDMATELQSDPYLNVYNASLPYIKTWYMIKGFEVENAFNEVLQSSGINQGTITKLESDIEKIRANKGKI